MTYKKEWRGKLRVDTHGNVFWNGERRGQVLSRHREGAKSPGGMVTNTVFVADGVEYPSMTLALEALVKKS